MRVLLSARYDEAIVNVDRSLQEIPHLLQTLLRNSEPALQLLKVSPSAPIRSHPSTLDMVFEEYRRDTSFTAHVERVTDALKDATADFKFTISETNFAEAISATQRIQEAANSSTEIAPGASDSRSFKAQYPELESKSLPPLAPVLKLLRLAQNEKQRFFIDIPVVDELQLSQVRQKIYFAISDYSLSEWAIANAGLFYLVVGLDPQYHAQVGVDSTDVQTNSLLLPANLEAAMQQIPLTMVANLQSMKQLWDTKKAI